MELYQLKCPNCGADLEVEKQIDTFFCKYCGTKLIANDLRKSVVQAKVEIKKAELEADLRKAKIKNDNLTKIIGVALILFLLIGCSVLLAYYYMA